MLARLRRLCFRSWALLGAVEASKHTGLRLRLLAGPLLGLRQAAADRVFPGAPGGSAEGGVPSAEGWPGLDDIQLWGGAQGGDSWRATRRSGDRPGNAGGVRRDRHGRREQSHPPPAFVPYDLAENTSGS